MFDSFLKMAKRGRSAFLLVKSSNLNDSNRGPTEGEVSKSEAFEQENQSLEIGWDVKLES